MKRWRRNEEKMEIEREGEKDEIMEERKKRDREG